MIRCKVCRSELAQDKDLLSQGDNDFIIEPCEVCLKQEELIEDARQSGYDSGVEDCEEAMYVCLKREALKWDWANTGEVNIDNDEDIVDRFIQHIKKVI